MNQLENKTILITGGTGSFGYEMTSYALKKGVKKIKILSRDEYKQHLMRSYFENNSKIEYIIGDVRDYNTLVKATRNVDITFHAAAMKRIEVCEEHPEEAVKTNVTGTMNIVTASGENNNEYVLNLSADKSIKPAGVYGLTKALSEKIILDANKTYPETKYINLRYSNVLGSRGSVYEIFEKKLKNNEEITVFDKNMKRLFLTQEEVMELCMTAIKYGNGGETFLKKVPLIRIIDLAQAMHEIIGKGNVRIESKMREGEKEDATLISGPEAQKTYELPDNYLMISQEEREFKKFGKTYGTHNAETLNKEQIKELLK